MIRLFLPLLVVFATYYLTITNCSPYQSTNSVIPSFIFPFAWTTLLILYGIAWYYSSFKSVWWYSLLLLSLTIYSPLSLCLKISKQIEILLLVFNICFVFLLLLKETRLSFFCLLPLLIWLLLVTILSF